MARNEYKGFSTFFDVEDVGIVGAGRQAQGQGGGVSHEAVLG